MRERERERESERVEERERGGGRQDMTIRRGRRKAGSTERE